jgi:hypothetical protein
MKQQPTSTRRWAASLVMALVLAFLCLKLGGANTAVATSFPTTSVVDNFNRANENPLGHGTWTGPVYQGDARFALSSSQVACAQSGAWCDEYWNQATYSDSEAYVTISAKGSSNGVGLFVRVANPNTGTLRGYLIETGGTSLTFYRIDSGSETQLGSTVTGLTWSAGDKLGFQAVGSTLTAYHYTGGAWSSVASRTDSTYATGTIGLESYSTSWTLDDFGGGAMQTTPTATPAVPTSTPTNTVPTPTPTTTATPTPSPTYTATATPASGSVLVGDQTVEGNQDSNSAGMAEAFQYTAALSGTANQLFVYLDSGSTAAQVVVGLYANGSGSNPSTLLAQGTIANPAAGTWNSVGISATSISSGTSYWIAILQPTGVGGTVQLRDGCCNKAQASSQASLASLPAAWFAGSTYSGSPLSAYAVQTTGLAPTRTWTPTRTATPTPTPTITPAPPITPPPGPTFFGIASGFSDSIPHQIVRTNGDRVYAFAPVVYSGVIHAYWSTTAGLPSAFSGSASVDTGATVLSVDTPYDGQNTVHVLALLNNGSLRDYPFNVTFNTFGAYTVLASNAQTISGDYQGSAGISAAYDLNGTLQIVYRNNADHIVYWNTGSQLDSGTSQHPVLAVSPVDNSVTVAWLQANDKTIRARTLSGGVWGNVELASSAPAFVSTFGGSSVDQSPSLVIDASGVRHLAYIENWRTTSPYDYGRVHYVRNSGSGWVDTYIGSHTHDPALALSGGNVYLFAHGWALNAAPCTSSDDLCVAKLNADGSWTWLLFAQHTTQSFDSSASTKLSPFRPETLEILFFDANAGTLYYGRMTP